MARFERPLHEMTRIAAESDVPVRKIPVGERALTKREAKQASIAAAKSKTGRPRKDGDRYPGGKLKPSNEIAPAIWQRIRANAIKLGEDARLGSELARLSLLGFLSTAQTAAGFRMAEIYGRYERSRGLRRAAKSAAYDIGHGDPDLAEDRMGEEARRRYIEQFRIARQQFLELQQELPVYPPRARAMLEALVIEDRPLDSGSVADVVVMLDRLVVHFGEKWRERKPGPGKPERKRPQAAESTVVQRRDPEPDSPAKLAFKMAMGKLRPDLNAGDIDQAWKLQSELQTAIADRERFRRDKRG